MIAAMSGILMCLAYIIFILVCLLVSLFLLAAVISLSQDVFGGCRQCRYRREEMANKEGKVS